MYACKIYYLQVSVRLRFLVQCIIYYVFLIRRTILILFFFSFVQTKSACGSDFLHFPHVNMYSNDFTRGILSNRRWSSAVAHTRNWSGLWGRSQLSMTARSQATRTTHFKRIFEKKAKEKNMKKVNCKYTLWQLMLALTITGFVRRVFWLGWGADVQMCSPYSLLRTCDNKTSLKISMSWKQILVVRTKPVEYKIRIKGNAA